MEMLADRIRPTKRPDADNVLKAIADSLNGLAYHDDAQLVVMHATKNYDAIEGVRVTIYPA
jgi:Holliday junction resolvase RusA-like endonuclease